MLGAIQVTRHTQGGRGGADEVLHEHYIIAF